MHSEPITHRLKEDPLAEQFPPLSQHEALVEANRCLFCYDAPCTKACPTHIDVPRFIKKISTDNMVGSARAILEANLLGATCARVCPVHELCEGACVLGSEHKPIAIGRLQRHAMDYIYNRAIPAFRAGSPSGKRVAVVGAGPAGLSCAGELARRGHAVTIFEKRLLGGGLSTYGIISIREPVDRALAEVDMIRELGVIFEMEKEFGRDISLGDLEGRFDGVFLAVGLGLTPALGIPGEEQILDGLDYIEQSKLGLKNLKVARNVVVIGAGNTAIDCATIARRLGAPRVTILYRRTASEMSAYQHEYQFARKEGVEFSFLTQPLRVLADGCQLKGVECAKMALGDPDHSGRPTSIPIPGEDFFLSADQVVKAIGQRKLPIAEQIGCRTENGFIEVDRDFMTTVPGVYAGGDCIRARGPSSTVMAVQDGKLACESIHRRLMQVNSTPPWREKNG